MTFRLVIVEWVDSVQPKPAWVHLSDYEPRQALTIASVGWLIHEGRDSLDIAPNIGGLDTEADGQVSGVITIPTRCVVKIADLHEAAAKRSPRR